jgi:hypothetical protein
MTALHQIQSHRATHDAQTDKTDTHNNTPEEMRRLQAAFDYLAKLFFATQCIKDNAGSFSQITHTRICALSLPI